jgi:Ca2+-binding RTX toxin-like protein
LTWNYSVSRAALQSALAPGQTRVDSFTIDLDDQHGGIITEQINVTLNGTGAPVIGTVGNDTLVGSAIADVIIALGGNDILTGLVGNDLPTGGAGSDTFVFSRGGRADIITDFMAGVDVIDLRAFAGLGYANLADVSLHSMQTGADLTINLGGANSIQLIGVNLASLHADDFAFA